jgi:ADP-dependent NAD(P)H-hydrate dehydratase
MVDPAVEVTPALLREWPLPSASGGKYARGQVLVVGGAANTPGAAQLAGIAALRVGAGHLTLAVADRAAVALGVSVPESGVVPLPTNASGSVLGDDVEPIADQLGSADAVLVGPGLDDLDQTVLLLHHLVPRLGEETRLLLDAYALAALPQLDDDEVRPLAGRLVLSPNSRAAQTLAGQDDVDEAVLVDVARRYQAVLSCQGLVVAPNGDRWHLGVGHEGLATSGSGDVLAGALAGVVAGGADLDQAACWATYLHSAAGDRLAARVGRLGFLAREILDELPSLLVELGR